MRTLGALIFAAVATLALPAGAAVVTLDFEGVTDQAQILNFYNGGTDSAFKTGPNFGVTFSSNATALRTNVDFDHTPSGNTVMEFVNGGSAIMDVAAGFTTGFSFYYSSSVSASVVIYSGLDQTGSIVGSINLTAQAGSGCTSADFCHWDPIGVAFSGIGKSVVFTGSINKTLFDNVTIGSATAGPTGTLPPNPTPEPSSLALVGLALLALRGVRGRR